MQKITPFLWFDGNAEEAVEFYTSVFGDSKVIGTMPGPDGGIMGATFQIEGQEFMVLNGGPQFTFTPAISLYVRCETQDEVDDLWTKLTDGGEGQPCGWLVDRFGVSWQIIPDVLPELLGDSDPGRAQRAMEAMLQMGKLDIAALQAAADG